MHQLIYILIIFVKKKYMKDISLHILDIVQNSISAKATLIQVSVCDMLSTNQYTVSIADNGKGIKPEMLKTIDDPWTTSRTTRKVGMGIPLFKQNAELTGGKFEIKSELGKGTTLVANFVNKHIDRLPTGDLAGTYSILINSNPNIDFVFKHQTDNDAYELDTREVKKILEDTPITNPEIRKYIKEMLSENIEALY